MDRGAWQATPGRGCNGLCQSKCLQDYFALPSVILHQCCKMTYIESESHYPEMCLLVSRHTSLQYPYMEAYIAFYIPLSVSISSTCREVVL